MMHSIGLKGCVYLSLYYICSTMYVQTCPKESVINTRLFTVTESESRIGSIWPRHALIFVEIVGCNLPAEKTFLYKTFRFK